MMPRLRFVLLVALAALAGGSAVAATPDGTYAPGTWEISAANLLGSAVDALRQLETAEEPVQRDVLYSVAITALTGLYQLHGCAWARRPLIDLYRRPDCPPMRLGYSIDGRASLRLEPLELKNPAYSDYTVFLCTLESNTSRNLSAADAGRLVVHLLDGQQLEAESLDSAHPLYGNLQRLQHTFEAFGQLPSGTGRSFKQLFATPSFPTDQVSTVSLAWGDYVFSVPYYDNEVQLDRTSADGA